MTRRSNRPSTPPRGWNSWDSYGTGVTESEVLANARFMAEHMLHLGWDTIVVDIQWYEPDARAGGYNDDADVVLDGNGRPLPATNRFPSASEGGFTALAAAVHDLGLRFGIHMMRGIPRRAADDRLPVLGTGVTAHDLADRDDTCTWNSDNFGIDWSHPDAHAYYVSLAEAFAGWGVDFVKADDMLWPYHATDIESLSSSLAEVDPDMVLSLSPGVDVSVENADHLAESAAMWRISDDLWDDWDDVYDQFQRMARWAPLSRPGAWADADMLPLGRIGIRAERGEPRNSRLTLDEQRTLLTLWSITGSPLMMGGDLPATLPETIALLTNAGVLAVNDDSRSPRELLRERSFAVWRSELPDGVAVAVFAIGEEPVDRVISMRSLGLDGGSCLVELWSGAEAQPGEGGLRIALPAHGAALYRTVVSARPQLAE